MNKITIFSFLTITLATSTFNASLPLQAKTPIGNLKNTQNITISGKVTNVVGNDFTLEDATGTVIVDAGPRWWQPIDLSPGESLTVIGEYDDGEFDAFSIVRANGETITIRSGQGKPPWAGQKKGR